MAYSSVALCYNLRVRPHREERKREGGTSEKSFRDRLFYKRLRIVLL